MKSILITGASSGIGRATSLRLADFGWRIFATVRNQADGDDLRARLGRRVQVVPLDVSQAASIRDAATQVEQALGGLGLDALLNNAGIGTVGPVEFTRPETLRRIFEVNLFGQVEMIQTFLPLVRKARGRIVNIGSVADHVSPPFAGAMAGSKAAFAAMSSALRLELRKDGIDVVVIEPGSINTPAATKTLGDVDRVIVEMPLEGQRRYGEALRKMAEKFLASERAGSPPDAVAKVIHKALRDPRPKARYPAGKDALKLSLLPRLLPERLVDRLLLKTFG